MPEKFPNQREIFLENGSLEPEDIARERDQKIFENWIKKEGTQNTPEWEEFLNRIDFNLLRSLFSKMERSCGIPEEESNFLPRERIVSASWTTDQYRQESNIITLENREPHFFSEEKKQEYLRLISETTGSNDIHSLLTVIHEESHATGKNVCMDLQPDGSKYFPMVSKESQSGFRRNRTFLLLNEGVVEKMSREILDQYLDAANWPKKEINLYKNNLQHNPEKFSYSFAVSIVDAIIKRLSLKNKIPEKNAWDALKRGLLEGEKFENPEVAGLFNETFDSDFITDLSGLTHAGMAYTGRDEDLEKFKKKYNLK